VNDKNARSGAKNLTSDLTYLTAASPSLISM